MRRDKTFYFLSFESFRQTNPQPQTSRVPTAAERAQVTDPVSARLLQFWPLPNTPLIGGTNWTGTVADTLNDETYLLRVDHSLSDNHRLTGRCAVFMQRSLSQQTTPFNGSITNKPFQQSLLLQETYNQPHLVNEIRLGYSRNQTAFGTADIGINPAQIFTDSAGNPLPGYIDTRVNPVDGGLPNITVTGFANFGLGAGNNMPQGRSTNTYEVIDDVTLTGPFGWSRHTVRFGGNVRREITNRFLDGFERGAISFPSWARFATGQPQRGQVRTGNTFRTWFRTAWHLYFQDTFKPRPNLTLNYGLRYEIPGGSYEKYNRGSNFVPGGWHHGA